MINNFPEEDPIFPRNLPPFDPKAAGPRWGVGNNQGFNLPDGSMFGAESANVEGDFMNEPRTRGPRAPGSWYPKNTPDPSPLHGDMYPRSFFENREFLQSPRFNLTAEELNKILNDFNKSGLSDELNAIQPKWMVPPTNEKLKEQKKAFDAYTSDEIKRAVLNNEDLSYWSKKEFKPETVKWYNEWLKKEEDFLKLYQQGKATPEQLKDYKQFKNFKDSGGLEKKVLNKFSPPGGPKVDGEINVNLGDTDEMKRLQGQADMIEARMAGKSPPVRGKIDDVEINMKEIRPIQPGPDMSMRARAGRGINYTTRGASTPAGFGLLSAGLSMPHGSQIAGEEIAKFERAAGRQATAAESAAIMGGGLGTAILDGATFGLYEGITRGREYSPNAAWLMEKALPGSTSGWGPQR